MKLIILLIFHSNFIFYHKLNKDLILTLLQHSILTLHYHPQTVFSNCKTVKCLQGIQLCYKPMHHPIITWLYCTAWVYCVMGPGPGHNLKKLYHKCSFKICTTFSLISSFKFKNYFSLELFLFCFNLFYCYCYSIFPIFR